VIVRAALVAITGHNRQPPAGRTEPPTADGQNSLALHRRVDRETQVSARSEHHSSEDAPNRAVRSASQIRSNQRRTPLERRSARAGTVASPQLRIVAMKTSAFRVHRSGRSRPPAACGVTRFTVGVLVDLHFRTRRRAFRLAHALTCGFVKRNNCNGLWRGFAVVNLVHRPCAGVSPAEPS